MGNFAARPVIALLLLGALAGCSSFESSLVGEGVDVTLTLLVEIPEESTDGSTARSPAYSVQATDGSGNELAVTRAELVLRELEFRRASSEDCVDADGPAEDDGDPCVELLVLPSLLVLPLQQGEGRAGTVVGPPGVYEALEFDLHQAEEGDSRVLDARPEVQGASVFVSGTFNDRAFSTTFVPTGPVELELDDPLALQGDAVARMTFSVEVGSWFRTEDGSLVDPEAAADDTALSREVRERILDSFSARGGF